MVFMVIYLSLFIDKYPEEVDHVGTSHGRRQDFVLRGR